MLDWPSITQRRQVAELWISRSIQSGKFRQEISTCKGIRTKPEWNKKGGEPSATLTLRKALGQKCWSQSLPAPKTFSLFCSSTALLVLICRENTYSSAHSRSSKNYDSVNDNSVVQKKKKQWKLRIFNLCSLRKGLLIYIVVIYLCC